VRASLRWLALAAIVLVAIEASCAVFVALRSERFSQRARVLDKLARVLDDYPSFLAQIYDPVLGWDSPAAARFESEACDGRRVVTTTGPDRARRTPGEGAPLLLLFGDSYTLGQEVNDEETYAWLLAERLGVPLRNHGVAGYSPVQAALKLERLAGVYPRARVAALGIMHGNLKRMLSRYRPIDYAGSGQLFGFKPYALGGRLHANPNSPAPVPAQRLAELASAAFREDWFARPEPRFPFSRSVWRLLSDRHFYMELEEDRTGRYRPYFADPDVAREFALVVERFVAASEAQGLHPVLAFVPRGSRDRFDAAPAVAALRDQLGARATLTAVGEEPGDWSRYNIKGGNCHPSAYGQQLIATHLERVLRPLLEAAPVAATSP
jgi:hypothetical protein